MSESDRERSKTRANEELKITDRRQFTADGKLREGAQPAEAEDRAESPDARDDAPVKPTEAERGFERRPVEEPRGVDFTMLINAMAEPALLFLGEIPLSATDEPKVDLERARIQIDMLDLLRVKCRGNLTPEEDGLMDRILYQLRMLYVARAKQPQT